MQAAAPGSCAGLWPFQPDKVLLCGAAGILIVPPVTNLHVCPLVCAPSLRAPGDRWLCSGDCPEVVID